jgi:hypothetical protein
MKVDYYLDSYTYFNRINSNINNGFLLDYGSNYGMFLDSSKGQFNHTLYTGIDIDDSSLVEGRKMFPTANFIHYNGFNCTYNPTGIKGLRPILDKKFSNIISYSVFTHTTEDDMLDSVKWLYDQLEVDGKLIASFCSVDNSRAVKYVTREQYTSLESFEWFDSHKVIYLFGNMSKVDYPELNKMHFTLYDLDYLKTLLSEYNIEFFDAPTDVLNCFQECFCITKKLIA